MVNKNLNKEIWGLIVLAIISGALIQAITVSVADVGFFSLTIIWRLLIILFFIVDIIIYIKYSREIITTILDFLGIK